MRDSAGERTGEISLSYHLSLFLSSRAKPIVVIQVHLIYCGCGCPPVLGIPLNKPRKDANDLKIHHIPPYFLRPRPLCSCIIGWREASIRHKDRILLRRNMRLKH